jgi:hypothetical protein
MISCRDKEGKDNIITVAWAGTICSDPPMLSVSIRPERHSYNIIKETGEFCVNLTDINTCRATSNQEQACTKHLLSSQAENINEILHAGPHLRRNC